MSVFVDIVSDESQVDSSLQRAPTSSWRGPLTRAALPLISVVVFLGAWQPAATAGIWNQTFVPYPSTVWKSFIDVSTTHDGVRGYAGHLLWEHLYMTLRRVFVGVVIGVLLGLLMGSVSWVRSVLEPWLTFLRALPPLAYFFLLVIWLGIDEAPKITSAESGRTTVFVTHSADEAAFLGSRIVVLTRRPGQVALDLTVDLPSTGVDPDELRRSDGYTRLRAEVGKAVKAAAA